MKRGCKLVFILLISVFLIYFLMGLANASFILGNKSHEITTSYGPAEKIRGWINISLQNEPVDSLLNGLDQNITIKEFLDKNTASYSCFPGDCLKGYATYSGENSKTFSINPSIDKIVGIGLTDYITEISSIEFDVATNAGESCFNPLKIDLLNDGNIEWEANQITSDYTCYISKPYGCYNASDYVEGN